MNSLVWCAIGLSLTSCRATHDSDLAGSNVVFGDSIAFGTGSRGLNLANCLTKATGEPYLNRGVPGETTRGALARLAKIESIRPPVVVISLGGNDVLLNMKSYTQFGRDPRPVDETLDNVRRIFGRLRAIGARVVYLDESPPVTWRDPRSLIARLDGRLDRIVEVARTYPNVTVIENAMEEIWQHADRMADDIHPNDAGYAIMCRRILDQISKNKR